ncbi:hypothetical protein O3M35_006307 [Rhynocoris fuscipes]|uniref:Uncharacterized protein n=1 Tax=Rhynocoris fuscipes TaxID=488301 RepID=A0AAW1DDH8_9HEMI
MVRSSFCLLFAVTVSIALNVTFGQDDDQCRTPPPNWPRRPPQCCDIPFPLESMKRHFGNCVRQIGRPSSAVPTAKAVMDARFCLEECVYKGLGLLESGDSLNKEKLSQELKNGVSGKAGWETAMEQAISTCFGGSSEQLESSESSSCSSTPHKFTHCVMRQLFLTCPADQWNNNAECNLVKERMQVCPNIPPPPPSPPNQRGPPQHFDFRN